MKTKYFKKLASSFIFSAFGIFTLVFFSPIEVFLGNPSDFKISINVIVILLGLVALVSTVIFSLLASLLPIKALKILNLTILATTLCYYIQSLFLNGSLIALDGEELILSTSTKVINLLIWVLIFGLVFAAWLILKKCKKEKLFITATKYVAVVLFVMQLTGFLSLFLSYDRVENENKSLYYSSEGRFEVSNEKNVVYFVIDYCDSSIVEETLKEDPDLFKGLEGFTYYPDNIYTHCRTFPALTYLLSGEKCYYDLPTTEYLNTSFADNEFMGAIDDLNTDVRIYTNPIYTGTAVREYADNYKSSVSNSLSDVKKLELIKEALKISGFRGMPYIAKERFAYDSDVINDKCIIKHDDYAPITHDFEFYNSIKSTKISINEEYSPAFRFYHLYGSHPGAKINENVETVSRATLPQALRGDMKIIKEYINQLKELGVYDNTTIIITADHGIPTTDIVRPQTCLLLVKEAGADTSAPLKTSNAQVSHDDLFPTIIKALGGDYKQFGESIDEIKENVNRKRYHYHTAIEKTADTLLTEYVIEGDGRNIENYKATGQKWEVKHSLYK